MINIGVSAKKRYRHSPNIEQTDSPTSTIMMQLGVTRKNYLHTLISVLTMIATHKLSSWQAKVMFM